MTKPQQLFEDIKSKDKEVRYSSFTQLMQITNEPVNWAYEVWDDLLKMTKEGDNHQRTIAVQLLSNLAKSDPEKKILRDFPDLVKVTHDEKFVTARHSLQSLWRIGIVSPEAKDMVLETLTNRFAECSSEKNTTLLRHDILEVFHKMYNASGDPKIIEIASNLIETEDDPKYRKKYTGLWKDVLKAPEK